MAQPSSLFVRGKMARETATEKALKVAQTKLAEPAVGRDFPSEVAMHPPAERKEMMDSCLLLYRIIGLFVS